jgi:(2S)-methylsuccinyl-CoA dehydrogenase
MASAEALISEFGGLFEGATLAVAKACAPRGELDGALLDRWQVPCFELANLAAELLAARTALAASRHATNTLDQRLALLFAADVIQSAESRLDAVYLDLGLDASAIHSLAGCPAALNLRRATQTHEVLASTGRLVAGTQSELGPVPLTHDVRLAQETFRRFAAKVVAPLAEQIHRQNLTVPESVLGPLREMGVFGLAIAQEFGGIAPDTGHANELMIAVTEALSEASLAAAGSLITRPEILSRALMAGGTDAQKAAWLPKIARGEPLCAIAITEPDFGSDVASLALKASRVAGGWVLDGAKTWCTFAGKAGLIMVVARTEPDRKAGHKGLSIFLVEKPSTEDHAFEFQQSQGGKLTGRAIATIGYRGMHSYDLSFEQFFVPDEGVIGAEAGLGKGFYFTMAGMTGGRLQTAARASGVMCAALKAAVRYANDRRVFGSPLIDYALTSSKIARMSARFAACRQLTYAVGALLEHGDGRMEASLVKLFACRSAELITREALQIHGGMGYAEETPVSRYFVDARVLSIFEGAEETLALKVVARSLLEQALKTAGPPP